MGSAPPVGRTSSLHRTGTLICSRKPGNFVCRIRLNNCYLYRYQFWTVWGSQAGIPRGRYYLAKVPPLHGPVFPRTLCAEIPVPKKTSSRQLVNTGK
jgi:hypothetical protein